MKIPYTDIEFAFEFVSSESPGMHTAIISKSTGKTYYHSEIQDVFEEIPEEVDQSDDYVAIPHKHDLDLGQQLVWQFVDKEIPGLYEKVRSFFNRRGAYSRYKTFLEQNLLLEKWYDFEGTETKKALLEWCEENGIETSG